METAVMLNRGINNFIQSIIIFPAMKATACGSLIVATRRRVIFFLVRSIVDIHVCLMDDGSSS